MKIIISILIIGSFVGVVVFLSSKITTFEECEKAGWLTRSIRIYDGNSSVEKECFLWIGKSFIKQKTVVDQSGLQIATLQKWESRIDDQASVTVTITPADILSQAKEWKFNIVMNTHSVELDQDMIKSVALVSNQGKEEYKPISWEGASAGGHHREGVLIFNQIVPIPKFIELKIFGIGNVARSFTWQLK